MAKTKILITVKTYPSISAKYDELVCTAGFNEQGDWIRIYPVPFRKLSYAEQYRKYHWIEVDLVKNTKDFRPESYRPRDIDIPIVTLGNISTANNWAARKQIVLKNVYTNFEKLIAEAKDKSQCTSLAVFKPTEVIDFVYEAVEREWDKKRLSQLSQLNLFESRTDKFDIVKKLPYKFSYVFKDETGKQRKLMNEDWELGALYWNSIKQHAGNEQEACKAVKYKYLDDFAKTKDLHFFVGTTFEYHLRNAPNPFVIIGTFTPKKESNQQLSLDF